VGVQVPRCFYTQMSPQGVVRELRRHLGEVFRKLAEQKECRIEEGHLLADHVHMMISIPPKYSVSSVVGFIKGKSAIHLARVYGEQKQNYAGQSFWARDISYRRWAETRRRFGTTSATRSRKTSGWTN
jgi:REP element-mobilizing transposase RayT